MTGARPSRKPSFQWLIFLVLAVIAALAALGLVSLRQDRRAAEQEAELLANALADSLARESATRVADEIQDFAGRMEQARNALLRLAYGQTNGYSPNQV